MDTVASAVNILAKSSLKAKNAVERLRLEQGIDLTSEPNEPATPRESGGHEMELGSCRWVVPVLCKEVKFVATISQAANQALNVELRPSNGGKSASDQRELHGRKN